MKKFLTIAVLAVTLTALSGCSWLTRGVQSTVDDLNTGIGDEIGGEDAEEAVPAEDAAVEVPAAEEATTPAGE